MPTIHYCALRRITIAALLSVILPGCGNVAEQPESAQGPAYDQSGVSSPAMSSSVLTPRQITISRETTFVEGPLNKKGGVEFVQALNNLIDPQVASDENAAVALCQVLGSGQPDQASHALFLQRIGADTLPMGETKTLSGIVANTDVFIEQQGQAMFRPWTADELTFPPITVPVFDRHWSY